MTPREFDGGVVQARLRHLDQLLDDLESVGAVTAELLEKQRMTRHAVERVLSQMVELAVSVNSHVAATLLGEAPTDYRSSFQLAVKAGLLTPELAERLKPSVGLRNVLAHEYVDIDLELVASAVASAQIDYRAYVHEVSGWLTRRR